MSKARSIDEVSEGWHFDREVIIVCVRWYLRFKLSLRDLVEMMPKRGLSDRSRPCAPKARSPRSPTRGWPGAGACAGLRAAPATWPPCVPQCWTADCMTGLLKTVG
jgi:hypothetical protein